MNYSGGFLADAIQRYQEELEQLKKGQMVVGQPSFNLLENNNQMLVGMPQFICMLDDHELVDTIKKLASSPSLFDG
jgi:hypothetical protein